MNLKQFFPHVSDFMGRRCSNSCNSISKQKRDTMLEKEGTVGNIFDISFRRVNTILSGPIKLLDWRKAHMPTESENDTDDYAQTC